VTSTGLDSRLASADTTTTTISAITSPSGWSSRPNNTTLSVITPNGNRCSRPTPGPSIANERTTRIMPISASTPPSRIGK
jgi:hypothetical protein